MSVPMPSPRGTNIEGAFIPARGAVAAYDAAPDDETDYSALVEFLSGKLEAGDLVKVKRILGMEDADATGANDAARRIQTARDLHRRGLIGDSELQHRLLSASRPQPSEADRKRFAEMFPDGGRLK